MNFKQKYLHINIICNFVSMSKLEQLQRHLKRGKVYRRSDLSKWSKSVDRHLEKLVSNGTLQKLSQGLYLYPELTAFGAAPPEEEVLVRSFLKDSRFLVTSFNSYNALGVGTTQLYNKKTVYNHRRHGDIMLGGKIYSFKLKPHFPRKVTPEFLLVDLLNNIENLAEDPNEILAKVRTRAVTMDRKKLKRSLEDYGNLRAKRVLEPLVA